MPEYNCERCLKDFTQKSHYDKHINKKNPCQNNVIKVENKAKELLKNTNIEEKNIDSLYSDNNSYGGHYSVEGNKKISNIIYSEIIKFNL